MSESLTMSESNQKLERELAGLAFLQDATHRSSQLTNGMVNILTSFEERLAKLEKTIIPVYSETKNLQQKQENIDKTLAALDHVIGYYSVSKEVESIIKDTPANQGLDTFLEALSRLQEAMRFFEKNNPQSVELENVMSLFESGRDNLLNQFKEYLAKHSQPLSGNVLLDAVNNDEEEITANHFALEIKEILVRIADWLVTQNEDEFMNVYARFRANAVHKGLLGLRDQLKSSSGAAASNQGFSPVSAAVMGSSTLSKGSAARYDTPSRKTSKKIQQLLERKANQMLLKASQTLEHSTGLALGPRRSTNDALRDDVLEEFEIESFLTEFTALLRLLQSELRLMLGIIPLPHQKAVLSIILRDALEMVCHDAESLSGRARRNVARQEFGPVLLLFPALRHLVTLKGDCDKLLEGCDSTVRTRFYAMVNNLHTTCGKALEDFAESVRSEAAVTLPKDGTVYEMTSNVMLFLGQLADLSDTVGPLLAQDPTYSNALVHTQPWPKPQRNKSFLGLYIKKVLVQLNLTLVTKSDDGYSDSSLRSIFRLNNSHYLLGALQRTGLLELLKVVEPECEVVYREMIKEQKKLYSQSWNKVLSPIWNSEDVPASVLLSGKLREKDKALIKEKFSVFNKEFDELAREQRSYSVPDIELRESLKRDNKEYILPKYQAFYDKYSSVQFSKNLEKYIRYTPAQVSSVIDTFFDVAA